MHQPACAPFKSLRCRMASTVLTNDLAELKCGAAQLEFRRDTHSRHLRASMTARSRRNIIPVSFRTTDPGLSPPTHRPSPP